VQCDIENKIIYRKNGASQVSIVSGGGSGHEPSFASFVGAGLLSGAVAGTIFASPSAEQIRRCILHRIQKDKGVLVIVMSELETAAESSSTKNKRQIILAMS
jgi:dihydroxyacetone kinase